MILDIIIILFLIFSAFMGYKKGLTTILVSVIGFVIAIILAFTLKSTLANFVINNTELDTQIETTISKGLVTAIETKEKEVKNTNEFYNGIIENMKPTETVENLAHSVVVFILETASFIVIFLVVKIIAFILQMMLNLVFDLPILSSINNIGGFIVGTVMGILKVWILLAILSVLSPMVGGISAYIDTTVVTKFLYDLNMIVKLLSGNLKL
ncbi:MAG: CvpA family protein [Clostridia bacterium]